MKLNEVAPASKGSYAGVRFSDGTKNAITDYIKQNDIPNAVPTDKLHTTVLYSRKYLPDFEPAGQVSMSGKPKKFEIWPSQPDDDGNRSNCLVLSYDCPELVERHEHLMDEHGATFDFDEYKPHVTMSYDAGDLDPNELPDFEGELEIVEEYGEDLKTDWAKNS